jgi:peptide/nickel transport system ATP-binding protein
VSAVGGTLLEIADLRTYFFTRDGVVRAVDGVSCAVGAGETLAVVGESGCGKSVTALSILRLVPQPPGRIVGGAIRFAGRDLLGLSEAAMRGIRGNEISMIFQEPMTSLNPVLTVQRQIGESLILHQGLDHAAAASRVLEMLGLVRIAEPERRARQYPHELSGGMRQRVAIARALLGGPRLLLMDEPFGALDEITRDRLNEELLRIWQETGTTIVFVTHSIYEAAFLGQQVMVMAAHPGRVRDVVAVDLPTPRRLALRETPAFVALAARLRGLLESG